MKIKLICEKCENRYSISDNEYVNYVLMIK